MASKADHAQVLDAWRRLDHDAQVSAMAQAEVKCNVPADVESLRLRVELARSCDYRGPVAFDSVSCGCRRVCNMGHGQPIHGTDRHGVTFAECLTCVSA